MQTIAQQPMESHMQMGLSAPPGASESHAYEHAPPSEEAALEEAYNHYILEKSGPASSTQEQQPIEDDEVRKARAHVIYCIEERKKSFARARASGDSNQTQLAAYYAEQEKLARRRYNNLLYPVQARKEPVEYGRSVTERIQQANRDRLDLINSMRVTHAPAASYSSVIQHPASAASPPKQVDLVQAGARLEALSNARAVAKTAKAIQEYELKLKEATAMKQELELTGDYEALEEAKKNMKNMEHRLRYHISRQNLQAQAFSEPPPAASILLHNARASEEEYRESMLPGPSAHRYPLVPQPIRAHNGLLIAERRSAPLQRSDPLVRADESQSAFMQRGSARMHHDSFREPVREDEGRLSSPYIQDDASQSDDEGAAAGPVLHPNSTMAQEWVQAEAPVAELIASQRTAPDLEEVRREKNILDRIMNRQPNHEMSPPERKEFTAQSKQEKRKQRDPTIMADDIGKPLTQKRRNQGQLEAEVLLGMPQNGLFQGIVDRAALRNKMKGPVQLSDAHEEQQLSQAGLVQQLSFSVSPQADEEELRREWQAFEVQALIAKMPSAELVQQHQIFKQHLRKLDIVYGRPADVRDRRQEAIRWNVTLGRFRYREKTPAQRSGGGEETKRKKQEAGGPSTGEAGVLSFSVPPDVTEAQARAAWGVFLVKAEAAEMPYDQLIHNRESFKAVLSQLGAIYNRQRSREEKEAIHKANRMWINVMLKAKYLKMTPEERKAQARKAYLNSKQKLGSLPPEFKAIYNKKLSQRKRKLSGVADESEGDEEVRMQDL